MNTRHTGPRAIAIVPARLGSTRLPRKMALAESGWPLCVHTLRNAEAAGCFEAVVLAYDGPELGRLALAHGVLSVATRADHQSGTDRILEAFESLLEGLAGAPAALAAALVDPELVLVNVQGDEPELGAADLRSLVERFRDREVQIATLWTPFGPNENPQDPNLVKVVADSEGRALLFSRALIPFHRQSVPGPESGASAALAAGCVQLPQALAVPKRHIGVYAFRPAALRRFCSLGPSPLERTESLEQLRWLEAGQALHLVRAQKSTRGIDTPEDYQAFVKTFLSRERPATLPKPKVPPSSSRP